MLLKIFQINANKVLYHTLDISHIYSICTNMCDMFRIILVPTLCECRCEIFYFKSSRIAHEFLHLQNV